LNLEIVNPESIKIFRELKSKKGIEITPEDPSFCSAECYPVLIGGRMKGAIIFPLVDGYPENKMELIAPENIKKALLVKTGDDLEVEVL
jgi:CTP-dependent riboflavin kinase